MSATASAAAAAKIDVQDVSVGYDEGPVVRHVDLAIAPHSTHAIIGPSGSGKTSLLRTMNLLAPELDGAKVSGRIVLDGQDILRPGVDRSLVRRRIGMVFAVPQPLPGTIRANLTYGPRLAGVGRRALDELVETSLRAADLWDEVKDRLDLSARALGGQQQRLCIARTVALAPEVVLLDEPCSGLDPISTFKIEETMRALQARFTWVLVTNNTKQAARVSQRTAFLLSGELIEDGPTAEIFTSPRDRRTGDYIEGRFG